MAILHVIHAEGLNSVIGTAATTDTHNVIPTPASTIPTLAAIISTPAAIITTPATTAITNAVTDVVASTSFTTAKNLENIKLPKQNQMLQQEKENVSHIVKTHN